MRLIRLKVDFVIRKRSSRNEDKHNHREYVMANPLALMVILIFILLKIVNSEYIPPKSVM